ncbi:MAG TPA: hypothetical protein VI076_13995 [Actinopolymorphaceae bacterium]
MTAAPGHWPPFGRAVQAVQALHGALYDLRCHPEATVAGLKVALTSAAHRGAALRVLAILDAEFTVGVVDDLVRVGAAGGAEGSAVRRLLGRVRHDAAREVVPRAVLGAVRAPDTTVRVLTTAELWPPLRDALEAAGGLTRAVAELRRDEATTIACLRTHLNRLPCRREALWLLEQLDTTFTLAMLDALVYWASHERVTLEIRGILGRLSHAEAEARVPDLVRRVLADPGTGHREYQMMADLLEYLGLRDALRDLCHEALVHGSSTDQSTV